MTVASMLAQVAAGLALGLGLIMPIGAQNAFILQQGVVLGYPRVFYATLSTTACDALLIGVGALGLGAVLSEHHLVRTVMLWAGGGLLLYLAYQNMRSSGELSAAGQDSWRGPVSTVLKAMAVSLLNPHAVLDTVGVLGTVALTRSGVARLWFAVGAVLASLVWFSLLGLAAVVISRRLTPRISRAISLVSSLVMAVFAVLLWGEALTGGTA